MNKLVFLIPTIAVLLLATIVIAKKDGANPIEEIWDAITGLQSQIDDLNTRIEQLEQCACIPCTDIEDICDDGVDNDCDGLTDGDDPDCVPSPCSYCVDGMGDTSLMCYLEDNVWKEGVAQSDYEWYWYYTDAKITMEFELTATNGGNYELCIVTDEQTCSTTSDTCWDAPVFEMLGGFNEVDLPFWLLVHRKDDTGNPGYSVRVRMGPV